MGLRGHGVHARTRGVGTVTEKRFKVVQDATGDWGILDTLALQFKSEAIHEFAPYGFTDGTAHKWMKVIHEHAIDLNKGTMDRDEFSWDKYEPVARAA